MPSVTIYTSHYCGFCLRAKALLQNKNVAFEEIPVDGAPETRARMTERAGSRTVPQIWIGEQHIGGCNELYQLEHQGKLDQLLY